MLSKIIGNLFIFAGVVWSKTADESSTGALLRFPYVSSSSPLYGQEWEVAPSQFGYHNYGGSLEGYLVLPKNTSYHLECAEEPVGTNQYIHSVEDWNPNDPTFIFLIDRGSCYFINKVENAQALGSSGAIVLDSVQEALFTMWPPEGWTDDITIPSVLLQYDYAAILMNELGVQNWNPKDTSKTIYPTAQELNWTIARLEWGLPHPDDRVEYEIWTSANDEASVKFKQNWRNTALNFDYNNYTLFTPHVYILNGTHWNCDDGSYICGTQCTNSGRYCAPDPEYDNGVGLNGMDVVQENLRSICVWKYVKSLSTLNESLWWDYSNLWNKNCWLTQNVTQTFTADCSYTQMNTLDSKMAAWVQQYIISSGGYNYTGGVNTVLEEETRFREQDHIYTLPTVLVNEAIVRGNIDCNQITEQTCQVLDAICAGFLEGTAPSQCSQTPVVNCSSSDKDCAGVCYGQSLTDRCGVCLPSETNSSWDSCVGCDGVPNSGKKNNQCGYCLSTSTSGWEDYGQDCRGICNGGYVTDSCGNCLNTTDASFNSCQYSSGGDSNSKASTSLTLVIVLSIVSFFVVVLCGAIVYQLWKRQKVADQRFTDIMKQYQLMDGIEAGKLQSVPNDEPDE